MRARGVVALVVLPLGLSVLGCAHDMEVMNLQDYAHPAVFRDNDRKVDLFVAQSSIDPAALWLRNAVERELASRHEVGHFSTELKRDETFPPTAFGLSIDPTITFDTSGWNFIINFPGGMIFTPAWHGYDYVANISTTVAIHDATGKTLRELKIDTPYEFRHADFGRCWWPVFQFEIFLNWIGGIYTSLSYDDDATAPFQRAVEQNYASFVTDRLLDELFDLAPSP
jgi:hypothetical protein